MVKTKLFDKWEPNKIKVHDFLNKKSQRYEFDFANVYIESEKINMPGLNEIISSISARGIMDPKEYTPDLLFEPNILEMYYDGTDFMNKTLKEKPKIYRELKLINIKKCSVFTRTTGFYSEVKVDYNSINNIKKIKNNAIKIRTSLENQLKEKFKITSEEISLKDPLLIGNIIIGECSKKTLELPNGTSFVIDLENLLHDEINPGILYMNVISNENGIKEFHDEVLNFCINYLNKEFKGLLKGKYNREVVDLGLGGDGSKWRIKIPEPKIQKALNMPSLYPLI